jgi:hypothetical protein
VNYAGKHDRVDSATLWDLPERRVPIRWDPDRDAAVARAHDQFR